MKLKIDSRKIEKGDTFIIENKKTHFSNKEEVLNNIEKIKNNS